MSIDTGPVQTVGLFTGQHVLAELEGVDPNMLDDEQFLRDTLDSALTRSHATVCQVIAKRFEPQGVTVLALLSESHASMHTYPEDGSIFIDVFTCGHVAQPQRAVELIAEALRPESVHTQTIRRGRDYETGESDRDTAELAG